MPDLSSTQGNIKISLSLGPKVATTYLPKDVIHSILNSVCNENSIYKNPPNKRTVIIQYTLFGTNK
jgi:hypothetical protein